MKQFMSFPKKRITDIGIYLAEFTLDLLHYNEDPNTFDENYYAMAFDAFYQKFLRYAETNRLITHEEARILDEDPNRLYDFIKDVAIDAAREIITEKA